MHHFYHFIRNIRKVTRCKISPRNCYILWCNALFFFWKRRITFITLIYYFVMNRLNIKLIVVFFSIIFKYHNLCTIFRGKFEVIMSGNDLAVSSIDH